ncbi:hypothetical protein ANCCAN_04134 [Ancylostoma caninum]|uniref:Uncharacterized protein n=1 Tax=Ancylostoma caninum TaxID=29170 RepID=A0A368H1N2_ANCCA|nr:hypothetical protein ANCCAN_04134 [Ancylostoma caninum]
MASLTTLVVCKYSCELEKLAGTLVTEPAGDVEGPYEVLTDAGPGILNLKDVVRKWKLQLQNVKFQLIFLLKVLLRIARSFQMGEKRIVGCNYSLGKNRYKIACIFQ